jgi:hypothetical protein
MKPPIKLLSADTPAASTRRGDIPIRSIFLMERLFTMPPNLELNWGQQSGPLNHSSHRLRLTCDSNASFARLFQDLWEFRHFDSEGNNVASVYVKESPRNSGTWYAFFDSKGILGLGSDQINDPEVPVRIWRQISKKLIVGDTCGKHMLGWSATMVD